MSNNASQFDIIEMEYLDKANFFMKKKMKLLILEKQ